MNKDYLTLILEVNVACVFKILKINLNIIVNFIIYGYVNHVEI